MTILNVTAITVTGLPIHTRVSSEWGEDSFSAYAKAVSVVLDWADNPVVPSHALLGPVFFGNDQTAEVEQHSISSLRADRRAGRI